MATIRINDAEFQVALRNFTQHIRPTPLLKIAAEIMRDSRERTFREQGSPAGSWPPLAASTLLQRGARRIRGRAGKKNGLQGLLGQASRNSGGKMLIRTGRLKNSITSSIVNDERLLIGTNLIYAAIQQKGGLTGRGHKTRIPARPYLVFRPEDPSRMQKAMETYITAQAGAAGFATGTGGQ